ncbi:MAG: NAD(+) synthase [Candidatus Gastranaerophilales bacterium]|nr:NAD(+) synthase [Candidatus Gastranaerophilales bacterium]
MQEITSLINEELRGGKVNKKETAMRLRPLINKDTIALAQTDPVVGDIEYNFNKAKIYIEWANELKLAAVVFPELFLMGYPVYDIIDRYPSIVQKNIEYLEKLAKLSGKTKVLIGFCEFNRFYIGKRYFNSVAVLADKKIEKIIRKTLLPVYSEFNDARYFQTPEFNPKDRIVQIGSSRAGIVICEENWADKDFFDKPVYSFDPVEEIVKSQNPDFIINCSSSPTRAKKEQLLNNMLSFVSKKHSTPIVYVNQVGAIDNTSFSGSSRCYNNAGEIIARAKSFEEQFFMLQIPAKLPSKGGINQIFSLPSGLEQSLNEQKAFSLDYGPDLERTYLTITISIKDYFAKNGFKRAAIGVSGGLDSSVCTVLLADALGAKNVYAISMPSKITSDESKNDAEELCKNLGVNFLEIPIKEMVEISKNTFSDAFNKIENHWDGRYEKPLTMDNIQARSRAVILWGISNEFKSVIPIATSDKSELYMGYATINGDMSGGFAPIADVTKTKLFALARWLNSNRPQKDAIPRNIINKRPGAELAIDEKTGKPLLAEDALMPYEFLDEIIWRIENLHQTKEEMLKEWFLYEHKNQITNKQKSEWIDKFYARVQTALFKWSIMPPSPIVDSRSINKTEYNQPITSKLKFY